MSAGRQRVRRRFANSSRRSIVRRWRAELGVGRLALDDMIERSAGPAAIRAKICRRRFSAKTLSSSKTCRRAWNLLGTVLNVVDFGAFVDVGLSDSGLIHISQLSAGYVRDPHEVVAVGDQVRSLGIGDRSSSGAASRSR